MTFEPKPSGYACNPCKAQSALDRRHKSIIINPTYKLFTTDLFIFIFLTLISRISTIFHIARIGLYKYSISLH